MLAKRFVSAENPGKEFSLEKIEGGTLWPPATCANISILGLVRDSNPCTPASQTSSQTLSERLTSTKLDLFGILQGHWLTFCIFENYETNNTIKNLKSHVPNI